MSQSSNTVYKTFVADGDLSGSRHCFVKLGDTTNSVALATADTDKIIGVVTDFVHGTAGTPVTVAIDGTVKVVSSGSVSKGAWVTATTGGKAAATTTSNKVVRGVALEAGAADGDVFEVMLAGPFTLSA